MCWLKIIVAPDDIDIVCDKSRFLIELILDYALDYLVFTKQKQHTFDWLMDFPEAL